ncbi:MAG: DUF4234 domain-containing protein [Vallitalea sp.]|nr:DUF4234 domain-containing protein [Vallitalea sp.]
MYKQRSVVSVILLSIITCGIYMIFWLYYTMRDINNYLGESGGCAGELILMLICFPYIVYWYYKYSKKIAEAYEKAGLPVKDDSLACLICGLFGLGVVSTCIIQANLNSLWKQVN